MATVHPTAIVHESATLAESVEVGPWCFIGPDVSIDEGTTLGPGTRIEGPTAIGKDNQIFGQSTIGTAPQDLKYGGERTRLEIGDGNVIREFVSINRGTAGGGGVTKIGSGNLLMVYAHVAHDCLVGSNVVFANAGTLAGHVTVGDYATIGAFTSVHQFCRVGNHAFLGGYTVLTLDALPFVKTVGSRPAKTYGINTIGLERKGFEPESIRVLQRAYRILIRSKLGLDEALMRIDKELDVDENLQYLLDFVRSSDRGVQR